MDKKRLRNSAIGLLDVRSWIIPFALLGASVGFLSAR